MFRTDLYQYTSVDDFTGVLSLTKTTNPTPADNEWCFNTAKELHIKDASASLFGAFAKDIYGLLIGDVIEISCEVYSIGGTKPKIDIDGLGGTSNLGLVNTAGYDYPVNTWVPLSLKYIIQKQNTYYKVVIGTFTSDIGEYKLRNIKIKVKTQTKGTDWVNKKFDERMYAIKKVAGAWTIDTSYSSDDGTISSVNANTYSLTFAKSFSSAKYPVPSISQEYGSGTYNFRIGSIDKYQFTFRCYDNTGAMIPMATPPDGTMFFVTLRGYI